MTFFEYNSHNLNSCQYLYQEFSAHYVYNKSHTQWKPCQQGFAIDCIYHCNSFAGEKYYLQLLLTVVWGSESFEHICTVHDVLHFTFQTACLTLGLLQNDNEWFDCFTKTVQFSSDSALWMLFAMTMTYSDITDLLQI